MNRLALTALVACATSSLTLASESEEWLTLDKEIETLSTSLPQGGSGFVVSGWLRTSYVNSSDPFNSGVDVSGFFLDNARINFDGSVGNFDVHIALEGNENLGLYGIYRIPDGSGSVTPIDAWADWNITDTWWVRAGEFRAPTLSAALMNENQMIFWQKAVLADTWTTRDQGVMVGGAFEMIGLYAAIQNGSDDQVDDLAFTVRGDWDILGGGVPDTEGAYGAADGMGLNVGAAYYDDASITDGSAFFVDAGFTMGPFAAHAEMAANDDGLGVMLPAGTALGTTTYDIDASFLFAGTWEVAGRFQSMDDDDDTSIFDIALNKYMEGHDAKFLLQWSSASSDDADNEADLLILGMTVSV
jgi:hypothetical protein